MKISELLSPEHYARLVADVEGTGDVPMVFGYWSEGHGYLVTVIAAQGGVAEARAEKCSREAARAALGLLSPDMPTTEDTSH